MKLSIAILEYELKKYYQTDASHVREDEELRLLSPLMYDDRETEDNRVYVLSRDTIPDDQRLRGTEVLIVCGLPETGRQPNCSVLYTDADSVVRLFNSVQQIYEKYQNWEREMCQILTEGRDMVQRIMDLSAEVHENMFHLTDASFASAFLSYPLSAGASINEPYRWLIEEIHKPFGSEIMPEVRQAFLARRNVRKTMYHSMSKTETLDYPLYKGSLYLGMLAMLPYSRPLGRHDYAIVSFMGEYVAYALSVETVPKDRKTLGNLQKVFEQLLDSKHIPKRDIQQLYDAVGFRSDDQFVCAAVRGAGQSVQEFSNYFLSVLESVASSAIFHRKGQYLAMVINVSLQRRNENPWQEKLRGCLKRLGLQAGISDAFSNFQLCELYYRSAVAALKLLPEGSAPDVYYFRDYKLRYAMEHFYGDLIPEMLYTDGFRRLLAYESTVTVSYIETLKVYLEENLNASSAARRLYISRNTFLARHARLYDILGEELEHPDGRFMLMASIRIYESRRGGKTDESP